MGGDIIAEKFALIKTRGSNGVSYTHIVEDTLLGERAVVKISDKLEDLGLDYLKAINLVREYSIPGLLVPFEGGLLEEEAGYYLAFPELGEPSLENYLRMGAPITSGDILGIVEKILHILQALHGAGFCHLFINTRNVFYRPRGDVTLKDPALKQDFFHPLLELVAAPDFSYLSPEVMDGGMPGCEADLYALGRLIEKCLEQVNDPTVTIEQTLARWLVERCRAAGSGDGVSGASEIARGLEAMRATLEESGLAGGAGAYAYEDGMGRQEFAEHAEYPGDRPPARRRRLLRRRQHGRSRKAGIAIALTIMFMLACAAAAAYMFAVDEGKVPALARGGGSIVGEEETYGTLLEVRGGAAIAGATEGSQDGGEVRDASGVVSAAEEAAPPGGQGSGSPQKVEATSPPVAVPPAEPSAAAPVASFTLSPGEGQSPLQVYIDASASYDPDGSIVSYAWSCGGSGKSFYHVFESNIIPAVIPVTLTVTDDGGNRAQATLYVTLY